MCATAGECPAGWYCAAGRCSSRPGAPTDAGTDAQLPDAGCGACDLPHATAGCMEAMCVVASCEDGFLDCDSSMPGCESANNTPAHCGTCELACADAPAHGTGTCTLSGSSGTCGVTCLDGRLPLALMSGSRTLCTAFGGVFVQDASGGCASDNPLAQHTCACPSGFDERMLDWQLGDGSTGSVHVCEIAAGSDGNWGGSYVEEGATCAQPNLQTASCRCPTGTGPTQLITDGTRRLVFCVGAGGDAIAPFAGAGTELPAGCGSAPCVAGACFCPSGGITQTIDGTYPGCTSPTTNRICYLQ